MSKNVLYVSDLDGTLLCSDEKTSLYTNQVINTLVEKGVHFSYATARSHVTASKVTKGLNTEIPVIVYNGAFIIDNDTHDIVLSNFFLCNEAQEIKEILMRNYVQPIVYSYINDVERFSCCYETASKGTKAFLDSRKGDRRENPVHNTDDLYSGNVFYFTCIDSTEKLLPVYDVLKERYNCIFQKGLYSEEQWLEIMPTKASKANAILQLKSYLNCEKIISFGDAVNDISMFSVSDECYAVENAVPELKEIATGIIESNNNDGVAKWLRKNVRI